MATALDTVPSSSLDFTGQKTMGVVEKTNHVKVAPKYGGLFKQGDIIRIEIPSQNWFDAEKFRVTFRSNLYTDSTNQTKIPYHGDARTTLIPGSKKKLLTDATGTSTGAAASFFKNGVQHCFNRVKLLQGSRVLEDIQDYGQLAHILHVASIPRDNLDTLLQKEGFGDTANPKHWIERKHLASKVEGHEWEVELFLGLFKTGKYLPTKYMGQLTIELYLEQNRNCLISEKVAWVTSASDLATPVETLDADWAALAAAGGANRGDPRLIHPNLSYQIDQVYAQCHFVVPIDEYDRAALATIESGQFEVHYDTFRSHNRQLAFSDSRQTVSTQEKALSIKNVFTVMRNEQSLNSYQSDSPYSKNGIIEYQWKIGNEYFPAQPVECDDSGVQALTQLQEALGMTSDILGNSQLTSESYCPQQYKDEANGVAHYPVFAGSGDANRTTRKNFEEILNHAALPHHFIIAQNFEKSQGQLSGFNTVESQVDIELILRLRRHQTETALGSRTFQPFKGTTWIANRADTSDWIVPGVAAVATAGALDNGITTVATNGGLPYIMEEAGEDTFSALQTFVHVDAILRMRGLGQLEVVS